MFASPSDIHGMRSSYGLDPIGEGGQRCGGQARMAHDVVRLSPS